MVTGERVTITITGGAPWGFRLQGGGGFPLEVAKIRKKSHASDADLREGDTVVSINGVQMSGKTHQSAMGLVDISTNQIVMEVIRPRSGAAASRPLDPQRQPRIIPMVDKHVKGDAGLASTASADYSKTEGNIRRDVHTDEFVNYENGKKITKTVTEERITRYPQNGLSPSPGQSGLSPAQSQSSLASTSQTSVLSVERIGRSPNRSPVMWKPPSSSPVTDRTNTQGKPPASHSYQPDLNISPENKRFSGKQVSINIKSTKQMVKPADEHSKENVDPIILSEQAKWEARHGPASVPKFKLENFGCNTFPRSAGKKWHSMERIDDPKYPMFEVYKPSWRPPKDVAPPVSQPSLVPPKALSPSPSPVSYPAKPMSENGDLSMHFHHPGMIKPPSQNYDVLQLQPPPPPPPMPSAPGPPPVPPPVAPKPKKFRPGYASTPKHRTQEEPVHHHHPDHLPVFAPKVYMTPEDDSGFPASPTRSEPLPGVDEQSDVSSLGMSAKKKLFSDSAFYDEPSHRYPTIDEQMSMCKKIAQSLTSAANRRAKGARMFLKRKRKSNKWVHDELSRFSFSEYSSEPGDIADLDDLDSELYVGEGGSRPLFSFRIPKIAGQHNEPTKMSLTKEEFEKLRLGSNKCDHHAVSPDMCFSIAADLQTNTRNKGAKLFHRRQQRVEKFVIDESNAAKPYLSPTKLEQILQNPISPPQKTPWNAAAQGNTFVPPVQPVPKHKLEQQGQVQILQGGDYNRKIKGWVSSSQPPYQESDMLPVEQYNYPEVIEDDLLLKIADNTGASRHSRTDEYMHSGTDDYKYSRTDDFVESTMDYHTKEETHPNLPQFGDYNLKVKGWGSQPELSMERSSQLNEQYRYKGPENYFPVPGYDL